MRSGAAGRNVGERCHFPRAGDLRLYAAMRRGCRRLAPDLRGVLQDLGDHVFPKGAGAADPGVSERGVAKGCKPRPRDSRWPHCRGRANVQRRTRAAGGLRGHFFRRGGRGSKWAATLSNHHAAVQSVAAAQREVCSISRALHSWPTCLPKASRQGGLGLRDPRAAQWQGSEAHPGLQLGSGLGHQQRSQGPMVDDQLPRGALSTMPRLAGSEGGRQQSKRPWRLSAQAGRHHSQSCSGGATCTEGAEADTARRGGSKADARLAKEALECLDLKQLRGHISCPDPCVAEYFGHFVVLAHLEHLADVSSIKRRRERSSADQLVRWGYALSGLKLLSTFGRKEAGGRQNRILPGWEDTGTEMAALQLPMGSMDMDRMRIRRGDSVTISGTDPLQDKLAEGTISDIRPGTLIVQLRGTFPEDCKEKLWRVDKSANATVYERQMWALLCLNHAAKVQPTVELLTAAPVGMADRWAKQWQTSREAKGRRSRSKSRATKKKKTRRKASSSSKDSEEQQKLKRRKRCSELADAELVEDHREDKQLQARKEVEEVDHMNESQRNAIHASLRQTCTVVQGPPGTGKTSVSVEILHFWAKALRLTPVLATSDSNVAVDNICEGLRARGVKAVRVGRPEKVRSVIEDMTLEAELKRLKEAERERGEDDEESKGSAGTFPGKGGKSGGKFGKGKFGGKGHGEDAGEAAARHFEDRRAQNRQDFELQLKILREAEVICTTTIAAGMDFLARLSNFEAILVDEVAQATELSTVVPLILRGANRLVLVGDHCQLPPAVLSPEAEVRGLSVSVYSRLVQAGGLTPFLLDTQYRSHPKLAEFSSQAFYEGLVKSGIEAEKRPAPMGVPWPNPHCPLAFINVNAQEEMEGDSKANLVEAQMVASVVGKVFQYGELSVGQVGVVTPYVAQVRRLKQLLRPVLPPGADFRLLECASVDNFQGREKDLIIFSAVRSNRAGNVGFLADWRRLNVMLTRARRGLLIFGNSETLKQDPTWEKWLAFAEKHECVVKDLPMPSPSFGKGWQAPLGAVQWGGRLTDQGRPDVCDAWMAETQLLQLRRLALRQRRAHLDLGVMKLVLWNRLKQKRPQRQGVDVAELKEFFRLEVAVIWWMFGLVFFVAPLNWWGKKYRMVHDHYPWMPARYDGTQGVGPFAWFIE
ncbi:unnamed protein product [Effrenium voratum]|nr:unnamed protein product [Effrenium voratum]